MKNLWNLENKKPWMIFLLAGLLLAVVAIPTGQSNGAGENLAIGEESRLQAILERLEGTGEVSVMITYQTPKEEKIEGIVIISSGGENSLVRKNITEVVQALFDVESHKIKVIKGNETN